MSERFIKYIPSNDRSSWLRENYPNAFLLLSLIAERARRTSGHFDGREIGTAEIGDWEKAGLTEQKYRTAKDKLVEFKIIEILGTRRNPQKSTTKSTTQGTLVKLLDSTIWDINPENSNDSINVQSTSNQRPTNDEQECKESKECKETPPTPKKKRLRKSENVIFFDRSLNEFKNITAEFLKLMSETYPGVNVEQQLREMKAWLLRPQNAHYRGDQSFISSWLKRNFESLPPKTIPLAEEEAKPDPFLEQALAQRKNHAR